MQHHIKNDNPLWIQAHPVRFGRFAMTFSAVRFYLSV